MKTHYLYLIEHCSGKKYSGIRGCLSDPKDDLGVVYFSSSSDLDFIEDQKQNPQDYTYNVLHKHHNRKIIAHLEISYHYWHDVGINENFYNRAKATSSGFSTAGKNHSQETRDKISQSKQGENHPNWGKERTQETKDKISQSNHGQQRTQKTMDNISQSLKGRKLSQGHKDKIAKSRQGDNHPMWNKKHTQESKDKMSLSAVNRSQKHIDGISKANRGKVVCRDLRTGKYIKVLKSEFDNDPLLVGSTSKRPNLSFINTI